MSSCGRCGVAAGKLTHVNTVDSDLCPDCVNEFRSLLASSGGEVDVESAVLWLKGGAPEKPAIPRPAGYFRLLVSTLQSGSPVTSTPEQGEHVLRMESGGKAVGFFLSRSKFRRTEDGFIARHPALVGWWSDTSAALGPIRQYGELYMTESLAVRATAAIPNPSRDIPRRFQLYKQVRKSVYRRGGRFRTFVTVRANGPKDNPERDVGPNYVRHRMKSPGLFMKESFRTVEGKRAPEAKALKGWKGLRYIRVRGAKAVVGRYTESAKERHGIKGKRVARLAWGTQTILTPVRKGAGASGKNPKTFSAKLLDKVRKARIGPGKNPLTPGETRNVLREIGMLQWLAEHTDEPEELEGMIDAYRAVASKYGTGLRAIKRPTVVRPGKNPLTSKETWDILHEMKMLKWFAEKFPDNSVETEGMIKAYREILDRYSPGVRKKTGPGKNPSGIARDILKAMHPKGYEMRRRARIEGKGGVVDELTKMGYSEEDARELIDIALDMKVIREPVIGQVESASLPEENTEKNPDVKWHVRFKSGEWAYVEADSKDAAIAAAKKKWSGRGGVEHVEKAAKKNPGAGLAAGLAAASLTSPAEEVAAGAAAAKLADVRENPALSSNPRFHRAAMSLEGPVEDEDSETYNYNYIPKEMRSPDERVETSAAEYLLETPGIYWRVWYKLSLDQTSATYSDMSGHWMWRALHDFHKESAGRYLVVRVDLLDSQWDFKNIPVILDIWEIPPLAERMSRAPPSGGWKSIAAKQKWDETQHRYVR